MADFLDDLKNKWDNAKKSAKTTIDEAAPVDNTNKIDELRDKGIKSFSKALVDATDFTPADMRQQKWAQEQKAQREGLVNTAADIVLPDQYSILPGIGSIKKVGTAAKEISGLIKAEKAAANVAKDINVVEATRKGAKYLDTPVSRTAGEKAADKVKGAFGNTITPDMPKQIGNADLMKELEKSKVWNEHRANREMFKNDNAKYMDLKEKMINAARKKLGG